MKNKIFVADFETSTTAPTYVWAWAISDFEENVKTGNTIKEFFYTVHMLRNSKIYFHNLRFDGEFILHYLLKNGYKHIRDIKERCTKSFETLITDDGQFYAITVYFEYKNAKTNYKVTFWDSLKVLPFSLDKVAKDFNLPISKLSIDYEKERSEIYEMTEEEKEYIKVDVLIMAKALKILYDNGTTKMTTASNAMADYKKIVGKYFDNYFPKIPHFDAIIRDSYKGGYTYCNPLFKDKILKDILVFDVNSLYPYVMYSKNLPFGEPMEFKGKYEIDTMYPLYVQTIKCSFVLKDGKLPTIQIKDTAFRHIFAYTEYLKDSQGLIIVLRLTNIDLKLFLEHYEVYELEYLGGIKFRQSDNLFKEYIDKWVNIKIQSEKEGNNAMRTIAKLYLNSLYGKFGSKPISRQKLPYFDEKKEQVMYNESGDEDRKLIYIPIATFVTAYAREITIRGATENIDRFIYCDTDSLHLLGYEEPKNLEIDAYKLGAWKLESVCKRGKFLGAKAYMEEMYIDNDKTKGTFKKITCSGMTKDIHQFVNFDNFEIGFSLSEEDINRIVEEKAKKGEVFKKPLKRKRVSGGVILITKPYTLKNRT